MKQVISLLFAFIFAGFETAAQVNILFKKDKPANIFTEKKSVINKKVQQLYLPRFSVYTYPLPPFKSALFSDELYYRYPTNPAYWTSRY